MPEDTYRNLREGEGKAILGGGNSSVTVGGYKNPRELAEKIAAEIDKKKPKEIAKVEVAGPGFINFYLSETFFGDATKEILKAGEKFGANKNLKGKKILLEKSAPNLFKPFHIGHFLNISIGESLARIFTFSGAKVTGLAYPSDVSLGVAKTIWAIMDKKREKDLTITALGECYVYGTKMYDENPAAQAAIIDINTKVNAATPGTVWNIYEQGRKLSLQYFKDITARLGVAFDGYFFESEAGKIGKKIVEQNIGKVFERGEKNSIIFPGEKYGLHTRVFVTSQGLAVYESKDIGLVEMKFKKYNPDISLVFTDVEQKQYFEVIKKAATLLFGDWGEKSIYAQHGRMQFAGGAISSRYGNVPLAEDLIDEVVRRVRTKMDAVERKSLLEKDVKLPEQVALAALRYSFLRSGTGKNIIFDFDKSLSFEGDSGPYLQYSYARARSILRKAKDAKVKASTKRGAGTANDLEKMLYRFPEVVARAGSEYAPHYIATYLIELASVFNTFYSGNKIVDVASPDSPYKVALTESFSIILKNGLHLLGIEAPERM